MGVGDVIMRQLANGVMSWFVLLCSLMALTSHHKCLSFYFLVLSFLNTFNKTRFREVIFRASREGYRGDREARRDFLKVD